MCATGCAEWRVYHLLESWQMTIRVFPRRTSFTPDDGLAFVGDPPLWRPEAKTVLVSCAFTWDVPETERLAEAWGCYYPNVEIGGPAYDTPNDFVPGLFVKHGVTFTSRGCNNRCPWCLVPDREGKIRELSIQPGYIVQDNNLLQCSRQHQEQVYAMLKAQSRAAVFSGGLQASLVNDWVAAQLRGLRIKSVFMAADTDGALDALSEAAKRLAFLSRDKLYAYVLIGRESMPQAVARLEEVWRAGCIPFAQLYQPPDKHINYDGQWRDLARQWSRPAIIKGIMKGK